MKAGGGRLAVQVEGWWGEKVGHAGRWDVWWEEGKERRRPAEEGNGQRRGPVGEVV